MSEQIESPTITPTTDQHQTTATVPADDLAKVRDLIITAHPDAVPELITGSSIDELTASVDNAVAAYQRIAAAVAPHAEPAPAVPGGASVAVKLDDLPAMELIRRGVAELKRRQ